MMGERRMEPDNGYTIYYPADGRTDLMFFRGALNTVMMASQRVKEDYGKWAEIITFKGPAGKEIHDFFVKKKYNLNAAYEWKAWVNDEIVLTCPGKVKVSKDDVIRMIGFQYTIEKEVKPEVVITIMRV